MNSVYNITFSDMDGQTITEEYSFEFTVTRQDGCIIMAELTQEIDVQYVEQSGRPLESGSLKLQTITFKTYEAPE